MSSSYFTNESLKSGWKYFHDKFVGDDKPVFNFDNVPIDTIKKNLEISSDPYDFHKLIITKTESKDKNNLWIYRNLLFYTLHPPLSIKHLFSFLFRQVQSHL